MKNKIAFKEGDKILLKAVKFKDSISWDAGEYIVEKITVGKRIRFAIPHKLRSGSFLFINQADNLKKAKLIA